MRDLRQSDLHRYRTFDGTLLKDLPARDLGICRRRGAIEPARVQPQEIGTVGMGNRVQAAPR